MNNPVRIQRKRTKGFSMQSASPNGLPVVYVGRPTKYGNRYKGKGISNSIHVAAFRFRLKSELFSHEPDVIWIKEHLHELRGKNLACWCKIGEPCHADVLLELANG